MISLDDIIFYNDEVLVQEYNTPFDSASSDVAFGTVIAVSFLLDYPMVDDIIMYRVIGRARLVINNTNYFLIKVNSISLKYSPPLV